MHRALRYLVTSMVLAVVLLLACNVPAHAAGTTATVSWTMPTTYTDGTTLPASDIAYVTIYWSRAGGPVLGTQQVAAPATSATVPVPCGGYQFVLTLTTNATATNPNTTSASTTAASYSTGVACRPNPPGGVTAS